MYYTLQDMANLRLKIKGDQQISKIIKHLITTNEMSDEVKAMREGVDYYGAKHKIKDRKIQYYSGGKLVADDSATNNKLIHPFHRNLVDQKIDKVLGDPITFTSKKTKQVEVTLELLGDESKAHKKIRKLGRNSSNKGKEWCHPYRDPKGEFKWAVVPAEQLIPVYETKYQEVLVEAIRYYQVTVIDTTSSDEEKRWKVEWWDDKQVTYYFETAKNIFTLDPNEPINPRPHFINYRVDSKGKVIEGSTENGSWERTPFILFSNNDECYSDLQLIKPLVDDYDHTSSDFSNTLADIQDVIWKLKGYAGEDLDAFMRDLKKFKAIKLDTDGDAIPETAEIPSDPRDKHMDRLERDIHLFGRGVNMRSDVIGNDPSGVALKFMFAWLDLKCKDLKSNMSEGIDELLWYATEYLNDTQGKKFDSRDITFEYNESFIINEAELIESIINSIDFIDDETLIAKHPWVKDVAEVIKKLKAQRKAEPKIDLGDEE